jgi:endonuclease IV
MEKYLREITSIERAGFPILVHLNDSIGELGSLIDRHAPIGYQIWRYNLEPLYLLLAKPWDAIIELKAVDEVLQSAAQIVAYSKV